MPGVTSTGKVIGVQIATKLDDGSNAPQSITKYLCQGCLAYGSGLPAKYYWSVDRSPLGGGISLRGVELSLKNNLGELVEIKGLVGQGSPSLLATIRLPDGTLIDTVLRGLRDNDSDYAADSWEQQTFGSTSGFTMPTLDSDDDGLIDWEEFRNGTDPHNPDSDNDSIPDGEEVQNGMNPLLASDALLDFDGDRISNQNDSFGEGSKLGNYTLSADNSYMVYSEMPQAQALADNYLALVNKGYSEQFLTQVGHWGNVGWNRPKTTKLIDQFTGDTPPYMVGLDLSGVLWGHKRMGAGIYDAIYCGAPFYFSSGRLSDFIDWQYKGALAPQYEGVEQFLYPVGRAGYHSFLYLQEQFLNDSLYLSGALPSDYGLSDSRQYTSVLANSLYGSSLTENLLSSEFNDLRFCHTSRGVALVRQPPSDFVVATIYDGDAAREVTYPVLGSELPYFNHMAILEGDRLFLVGKDCYILDSSGLVPWEISNWRSFYTAANPPYVHGIGKGNKLVLATADGSRACILQGHCVVPVTSILKSQGQNLEEWDSIGVPVISPSGDMAFFARHIRENINYLLHFKDISDEDHDGLPDDWEKAYFHTTSFSGTDDTDGDGKPNLLEYQMGTRPNKFSVADNRKDDDDGMGNTFGNDPTVVPDPPPPPPVAGEPPVIPVPDGPDAKIPELGLVAARRHVRVDFESEQTVSCPDPGHVVESGVNDNPDTFWDDRLYPPDQPVVSKSSSGEVIYNGAKADYSPWPNHKEAITELPYLDDADPNNPSIWTTLKEYYPFNQGAMGDQTQLTALSASSWQRVTGKLECISSYEDTCYEDPEHGNVSSKFKVNLKAEQAIYWAYLDKPAVKPLMVPMFVLRDLGGLKYWNLKTLNIHTGSQVSSESVDTTEISGDGWFKSTPSEPGHDGAKFDPKWENSEYEVKVAPLEVRSRHTAFIASMPILESAQDGRMELDIEMPGQTQAETLKFYGPDRSLIYEDERDMFSEEESKNYDAWRKSKGMIGAVELKYLNAPPTSNNPADAKGYPDALTGDATKFDERVLTQKIVVWKKAGKYVFTGVGLKLGTLKITLKIDGREAAVVTHELTAEPDFERIIAALGRFLNGEAPPLPVVSNPPSGDPNDPGDILPFDFDTYPPVSYLIPTTPLSITQAGPTRTSPGTAIPPDSRTTITLPDTLLNGGLMAKALKWFLEGAVKGSLAYTEGTIFGVWDALEADTNGAVDMANGVVDMIRLAAGGWDDTKAFVDRFLLDAYHLAEEFYELLEFIAEKGWDEVKEAAKLMINDIIDEFMGTAQEFLGVQRDRLQLIFGPEAYQEPGFMAAYLPGYMIGHVGEQVAVTVFTAGVAKVGLVKKVISYGKKGLGKAKSAAEFLRKKAKAKFPQMKYLKPDGTVERPDITLGNDAMENAKGTTALNLQLSVSADEIRSGKKTGQQCFGPDGCLVSGTLVMMRDGSFKSIDDVSSGDEVAAFNFSTREVRGFHRVLSQVRNRATEVIRIAWDENGDGKPDQEVGATPEHPFFTAERGWVHAEDLQEGETLGTASNATLIWAVSEHRSAITYNLDVDGENTFLVSMLPGNAVAVHNAERQVPMFGQKTGSKLQDGSNYTKGQSPIVRKDKTIPPGTWVLKEPNVLVNNPQHHFYWDAWMKHRSPKYKSRATAWPAIELSNLDHAMAHQIGDQWFKVNAVRLGLRNGKYPQSDEWGKISLKDMNELATNMMVGIGISPEVVNKLRQHTQMLLAKLGALPDHPNCRATLSNL